MGNELSLIRVANPRISPPPPSIRTIRDYENGKPTFSKQNRLINLKKNVEEKEL